MPLVEAHLFITGTPSWSLNYWHAQLGANGKGYRSEFAHAPFAEILGSRAL
jgi:hypothetical protein